jgi:two-component system cell cycle sensor histidine kinase/response regulator CckA
MAVRFMPFAHWNPDWKAAACSLSAACAGFLAVMGHGEVALALLAGAGAACVILLAAGQLHFGRRDQPSDARLSDILKDTPAAIAITSRSGRVFWRTSAFATAARGPGIDRDLSRLGERHPETAAAIFRLFSAARQGKAHEEMIVLPYRKTDDLVRLKVSVFPGESTRPQIFIWQIEDPKAGLTIEGSRSGFLDTLPMPALIIAKDLSIEAANKRFETLLGAPAIGAEAWTLFRTKRGKPFTRPWLRDMIAKGEQPVPIHLTGAGGVPRPVLLHCAPAEAGRCLCLAVPASAAANLDDLFETLLAQAPSPMALLSSKGIIQATNDGFRDLFLGDGRLGDIKDLSSSASLSGKSLALLVADASAQNVQDQIASLGAGSRGHHNPIDMHAVLKGPDGRRVRLMIFPAVNGSNLIVQAIETGASVLTGEAAAQSQKLQAVGELAGGIAHDFNNLLTAIIGYSDLLLRRFRASDPAFKDVMNIKSSAARAAELVAQILAYSRRQTLRPAILKLTDVIEQFRATMGRTLGERVKTEVQHGRDLWFVKADEGQLFQVVMNLAVNARDAMPDGGEITIRTANVSERESLLLKERGLGRGEYVLCEVKDTGTGIKPEHLEKIFDPFFSTKEVGKGTGLGLSTVYGIVKQTGGTILVDSQMGVGTSFRIYLPRYVETEADLKTLENRAEAPAKIADLTGSGTVLLVEDEEAVRSLASRALSTRGYTVLEAGNGTEALEIMDREHGQVDLVVSDVVMPGMDGPTLLRHLRERNPGIRIVFMSGYAEEAFRKNLGEDEDFIFLPKPFTLKKLAETVKAAAA